MKRKIIALFLSFICFVGFQLNVKAENNETYLSEDIQYYCYEIGEWYGICPELLMAIIESESSGNPDAENGSCKGLMQVSTRWHYDRMKELDVENIFDPYGNIMVGADYLYELMQKHEDVGLVLMVYNGDSRAEDYSNGNCELSNYARKILERSEALEKVHGK